MKPHGGRRPVRAAAPILGTASLLVLAIAATGLATRGSHAGAAPVPMPAEPPAETTEYQPAAPPPVASEAPQAGPVRLSGLAGDNLNLAMAAAGVSEPIAQEYLRALASRIPLAGGISVADRFDRVVERAPGAPERLVYAGLDRLGASDVQLMRWAEGGKNGWMDASGTAAEAQTMRMPIAARVSSAFGMRRHPILRSHRFHRGVELKAAQGTPIRASADGRVTYAGWTGGYGRQVMIDHGQGLGSHYAHMSRIAARPGERVSGGQVIGFVGSSGLSTGPHLPYEVLKNGRPVNPLSVRFAGTPGLGREERSAFNAKLRHLLSGGGSS